MTLPLGPREPCLVELGPGEYRWCSCGRARTQPWCDDACAGTGDRPLCFSIVGTRVQRYWICACRRSRRLPFCDGTHNRLSAGGQD